MFGCLSKQKQQLFRPRSWVECESQCWEGPEVREELDLAGLYEPQCDRRAESEGEKPAEANSSPSKMNLNLKPSCLALKLVLREWMITYLEHELGQYQGGGDVGEFPVS